MRIRVICGSTITRLVVGAGIAGVSAGVSAAAELARSATGCALPADIADRGAGAAALAPAA